MGLGNYEQNLIKSIAENDFADKFYHKYSTPFYI